MQAHTSGLPRWIHWRTSGKGTTQSQFPPTFTQAMVIVITQGHEFTSVGIVAISGGLRPQSHTGQQGKSA